MMPVTMPKTVITSLILLTFNLTIYVCGVEFMFEYIVSKAEERKIINHPLFDNIVAKYW